VYVFDRDRNFGGRFVPIMGADRATLSSVRASGAKRSKRRERPRATRADSSPRRTTRSLQSAAALSIVWATKLEGQAPVPALVAGKALSCQDIWAATGGRPYKSVAQTMDEAIGGQVQPCLGTEAKAFLGSK